MVPSFRRRTHLPSPALARLAGLLLAAASALTTAGCGGKDKEAQAPKADANMEDAFALLPGQAVGLGTVDARAFFSSKTFGAELAVLVEKYIPLGQEAGFSASRDVDRVTFASYSFQGIDAAAVIVGRFDEAKIKDVAAKHTPTKGGGMLVTSTYAGREVFTVNNVGFTLLSPTKAIGGSESGIRRVLERIKDGRVKRDLTPWMIETVETSGAAAAVAVDMASQPVPAAAMRQVPVAFVQQARSVRVLATFKESGLTLAGSLSYADEGSAQTAAEQVRQTAGMSKWLALVGIKIQNVDIKSEKQDVQVKLEVDDRSLRSLVGSAGQWLGP